MTYTTEDLRKYLPLGKNNRLPLKAILAKVHAHPPADEHPGKMSAVTLDRHLTSLAASDKQVKMTAHPIDQRGRQIKYFWRTQ